MKVIVLAGGLSPERDVSLKSGSLVANSLIKSGYDVMLLDLYLGINNKVFTPEYRNNKMNSYYSYEILNNEPDLEKLKKDAYKFNKDSLIGEGVIDLCKNADIVFMALHGSIGENGKLQALFDIYGIKYTGTGCEGSVLAMNKNLSKEIMMQNNINTAKWIKLSLDNNINYNEIKYPCVVKPCTCGSSIGISILDSKEELENALVYAKKYENNIIIEEKISGREFSVGILENKALPPIEIIPKKGFYDYKNKYEENSTIEVCPVQIDSDLEQKLKEVALKVHKVLNLGMYSRIDFIVDKNNDIYCLEANTLPGMTQTSLLPQEAKSSGIDYDELCEKIIHISM